MKKLVVLVFAALGCVAAAFAQDKAVETALVASAAPGATNIARPKFSSVLPATPKPAPAGRSSFGEEDSWQLSTGYAFVRFRSSLFDASLNGIQTRLVKYFNESFGVEGGATAAFAGVPSGFGPGSDARYLFYGAGVRARWPSERRFEPWGHVVLGGIHMQPQTAGNSRSAFAYELGGGVDWRWKSQIFLRAQGDWVRSHLYQESQNNFQFATGIVFTF